MRKREITAGRRRKRRKSFFLNPTDVHWQPEAAQLSGKPESVQVKVENKVEKKFSMLRLVFFFLISQSLKQIASASPELWTCEVGELLWRVDGESAGAGGEASIYVWRQESDWGKLSGGGDVTWLCSGEQRVATWCDKVIFSTLVLFRRQILKLCDLKRKEKNRNFTNTKNEYWLFFFYRMKRLKMLHSSWVYFNVSNKMLDKLSTQIGIVCLYFIPILNHFKT